MTSRRQQVLDRVRQWAHLADEDFRLAKHALTMSPPRPYRLIAYHAQQCVEKYLKAYLVLREIDFPFTHNISILLELCSPTTMWATQFEGAEALSLYAVTTRYPGFEEEVEEHDAEESVAMARDVTQTVRQTLQEAGVNLLAD